MNSIKLKKGWTVDSRILPSEFSNKILVFNYWGALNEVWMNTFNDVSDYRYSGNRYIVGVWKPKK